MTLIFYLYILSADFSISVSNFENIWCGYDKHLVAYFFLGHCALYKFFL